MGHLPVILNSHRPAALARLSFSIENSRFSRLSAEAARTLPGVGYFTRA
jgi:hypothetical protein